MSVTIAHSIDDACAALIDHPDAVLLAGGTDLMVAVNRDGRAAAHVVALDRVPELSGWHRDGDVVQIGAGVTYADLEQGALADLVPGLAQAARTVGSPQIRNAGTIGGNLGTASPAGDTLPVLVALDADVVLRSASGSRQVPIGSFLTGVKRTDLRPGELIEAVRVPVVAGPQEFCKVGTRNAMVISVVSLALVVDRTRRRVGVGLGSVGPTPLRAPEAEAFLVAELAGQPAGPLDGDQVERFAELVASAASPIDDHRGSAAYRRHAVAVLAARACRRAFPGAPT